MPSLGSNEIVLYTIKMLGALFRVVALLGLRPDSLITNQKTFGLIRDTMIILIHIS